MGVFLKRVRPVVGASGVAYLPPHSWTGSFEWTLTENVKYSVASESGRWIRLLLFFLCSGGSKGRAACAEVCSWTACFLWQSGERFGVLLAIKSAGPRLRGKLTKMINSLNSHLTRRDSPGHGTPHSALSLPLPLPLRLSNIKFIAQCLNRCINITNGLLRAWNYLWVMN